MSKDSPWISEFHPNFQILKNLAKLPKRNLDSEIRIIIPAQPVMLDGLGRMNAITYEVSRYPRMLHGKTFQ
jgi:hypothetical protein